MSNEILEDTVRQEVRAWLNDNWSPDLPREQWRILLADSGWAAPTWPTEWFGRGLPKEARRIVHDEFASAGARGTGQDVTNLFANVILTCGTDDQKRRFVRPLMLGEIRGCLLYSEPGAGSDLAALQTRAERDGDEWVVNGQKVWTSGARESQYGLLAARTDWDQPKHRGITFFWFPMDQPGVDVRPIRQVTGGAEFNEVFLTDARVADTLRLGAVNDGWRALQIALGFERLIMGASSAKRSDAGKKSKTAAQEQATRESPWTRQVGGANYVELAKNHGKAADPLTRQDIAKLYTWEQVNRWNSLRARAEAGAGMSSPVASLGKLAMSRIVHFGVEVTSNILGAESILDGEAAPVAAEINRSAFAAYVTSIGGGTDQIQRNIIGERILGLPKEPEADKNVPFRDVRKAAATRKFS
ncbi:MAG TPA: acyl-CoA dehydrogenase family protein [Frankiaceae bacterium]|jgi:alkylation response protein AidB-like acyl-CoA dehydrogenase|nr:acyl-CoA dehydrogenase family protein [Frankiaceae bacterium]